jgi:hypothetical protein
VLQYLITAVHSTSGDASEGTESHFVEQDYLGYVARAIHDYPILTHDTEFPLATAMPNANILADYIDENAEIELVLRPAPPEETLSFYASGQQNGVRPSLFVEVRVALIEPEPPKTTLPGTVLSLGALVAPMGKVGLTSSRSSLSFMQLGKKLPLEANPGRVAVFANPPTNVKAEVIDNNRLTLDTYGTIGGDAELLLEGNGQKLRVPTLSRTPWDFQYAPNQVSLRVFSDVEAYLNTETTLTPHVTLAPGLYGARLLVRYPDLRTRTTNSVAFFVMPHILDITKPNASGVGTVTLSGAYLQHPTVTDLEFSIGSDGFRRRPDTAGGGGAVALPGTFEVTAANTITYYVSVAPGEAPTGQQTVQLSVNGVPALPQYEEF